jgi:hypothetical protein
LNFYTWLDEVGGFTIFAKVETVLRKEKEVFDSQKRAIRRKRLLYRKANKRVKRVKADPKDTLGENYKTHILQYDRPIPMNALGDVVKVTALNCQGGCTKPKQNF